MKVFFEILMEAIFIMLPLILIMIFFIYSNTYRIVVQVTNENMEKFNELLELNEVGIKIDESVKEIVNTAEGSTNAYERYEVVYHNGEVKKFDIYINAIYRDDLDSYISECRGKKNILNWPLIFVLSTINSFRLIFKSRKTEIIED